MTRALQLTPVFVDNIPDNLEEGIVYISIKYATAVHKCCCGCGQEAVTPLSPIDWQLIFDGRTVSLTPSIGNWNFPCRSHYWITKNRVKWSRALSNAEITALRERARRLRDSYYGEATR